MNASARATHIGPGVCWDHVRIDVEGYEGFGAARKLIYAHWIHARGLRADVVQDTQQVVHLLRARLAAAALSVRLSAPQRGKHANLYANPTLADVAYLLFFLDYTYRDAVPTQRKCGDEAGGACSYLYHYRS